MWRRMTTIFTFHSKLFRTIFHCRQQIEECAKLQVNIKKQTHSAEGQQNFPILPELHVIWVMVCSMFAIILSSGAFETAAKKRRRKVYLTWALTRLFQTNNEKSVKAEDEETQPEGEVELLIFTAGAFSYGKTFSFFSSSAPLSPPVFATTFPFLATLFCS